MESDLQKYLVYSLVIHGFIVLLFAASPYLPFHEKILKREKIVWISLPKGFGDKIGIGLKKAKGMPQTTIAESKKPLGLPPEPARKKGAMTYTPPEKKKEKAKVKKLKEADKAVAPKPKKKKRDKLDERMKKALAKIEADTTTRPPEAAQIPKELEEGGVPFGSATGPYVSPDDPIYVLYQAKVRHEIMEAWVLPLSYIGKEIPYSCEITVKIDQNGRVIRTKFESRSGNEAFDQSALRAIHQASPLDRPPEKLKMEAVKEGFLVEFDPEVKNGL